MKRTNRTRNNNGILPLTAVHTYARKDDVPNGSGTLFAVDHRYPNSLKEKSSRFFRMDYVEFFQRLEVTPLQHRCYYECVEGDRRKPYADIEYEYTDDKKDEAFNNFDLIIGHLLLGIMFEMNDKKVPYVEDRDCIKLSSHGPGKRSMHIIINNWYFDKCSDVHNSNVKSFWLSVRNRVPQHLWHFVKIKHGSEVVEMQQEILAVHAYAALPSNMPLIIDTTRTTKKKNQGETIDTCVYSSFRQFRLVWNTKLGKDRFLDIDPSTGLQARNPKNPDDPENLPDDVQKLRLFEGCMITMTSNCKQLPDWIAPDVNPRQVAAIKNMIAINSSQRDKMVNAFNASDFSRHYRLDFSQSSSKNSIYMIPITKPVWCSIHNKYHRNNNAKLCYSAKGNIYVSCFSKTGGNSIQFIESGTEFPCDTTIDTDEVSEEDIDGSDNDGEYLFGIPGSSFDKSQSFADNVICSEKSSAIGVIGDNKFKLDLSLMPQRVQYVPINVGDINISATTAKVHKTLSSGSNIGVNYRPIINIETTNVASAHMQPYVEGQCKLPTKDTTIATLYPPVEGNTKFQTGYEYIVQATPIINGTSQQLSVENKSIMASPTKSPGGVNYCPIINIETTNRALAITSSMKEDTFVKHQMDNNSMSVSGINKLDENSSQINHRRVQATPIIGGVINNDTITAHVHKTLSSGSNIGVNYRPIINIETTNVASAHMQPYVEGQCKLPTKDTTIATFVEGNTKFQTGYEYIVKEVYDSYEKYRCGQGTKYNLSNGDFSKALTSLGHTIQRKGRSGIRVVTLKRSDPIVNTNPVEALNAISGKTTAPSISPDEALALLQQNFKNVDPTLITNASTPTPTPTTTANATTPTPQINKEIRLMNPHVDVRNFVDVYLTQDSEAETDPDNLFLCFIDYCKDNSIVPNRFGKKSLINYIKKWLLKPGDNSFDGRMIKGYRCKVDKEEINNALKEKNLRRIWQYNTAPYQIGWHNGRANERYSKLSSKPWRKIDVHYRHDRYCRPIPELISMTNAFEKNLPDRVIEIQQRQFRLLASVYDPTIEAEMKNMQTLVVNALLAGVLIKDSVEHCAFKLKIEELRQEALRINRDEYQRLEESIKEDQERLLTEISWCCAVRSTFRTGKTFNLKPYIEAFPEMRVLIVLPRISLTNDYMQEYEAMGFIIRDENTKGKIRGNRVMVCLPSLAKVRGEFDLVCIDEFKAVMDLQHTLVKKNRVKNRTTGRYQTLEMKCYNALCHYVANTKRVYIADALLTNAHVLEISKMRQQSDEFNKRVTVYQNLYQKHKDNIVYTVDNQALLVDKILKLLRKGKRVAVPTNSKEFAEFLHNEIMKSDLNVTISLSTSENKPTVPIPQLWHGIQCIIYSPTILAGNSYEEPIDVVCGLFTKLSCDQADSLQMLMRCRNVTSKKYYICVTPGPGRSPLPNSVYPSSDSVRKFLMHVDNYDTTGWPEEFIIPMDMIQIDPIHDTIRANSMYFNSHCNYMKQVHIASYISDQGSEYLFRMLLYMRDAGFSYGGNIYTKSSKKEALALIKEEKNEFSKERREEDLEQKYTCADANKQEYHELTKKTNKSKDDVRRIIKYRIKHKYQVNNVPKWLFEIDRKYSKQFVRITRYLPLNEVTDRTIRNELQANIRIKLLETLKYHQTKELVRPIENNLTNEILMGTESYNPVEDIAQFWSDRDIELCENSLKILELIGAQTFIRNVPRFEVPYNESNDINKFKEYIGLKEKKLREFINDSKKNPSPLDTLASKVTKKAFGIKFDTTPTGYNIDNMWIKSMNSLIWPFNWSNTDREELRILVPEPTVSDKATSWINTKIPSLVPAAASIVPAAKLPRVIPKAVVPKVASHMRLPPVIPLNKFIAHAPPIGADVNNKTVQAQVALLPQIVPVPVVASQATLQKRCPVVPIINNQIKL